MKIVAQDLFVKKVSPFPKLMFHKQTKSIGLFYNEKQMTGIKTSTTVHWYTGSQFGPSNCNMDISEWEDYEGTVMLSND